MVRHTVDISTQWKQWMELKNELALPTDEVVAKLLLERYQEYSMLQEAVTVERRCLLQLLSLVSPCTCGENRRLHEDNTSQPEPHVTLTCDEGHVTLWYCRDADLNESLAWGVAGEERDDVMEEDANENAMNDDHDEGEELTLNSETGEFTKQKVKDATEPADYELQFKVIKSEVDANVGQQPITLLVQSDSDDGNNSAPRRQSARRSYKTRRWQDYMKVRRTEQPLDDDVTEAYDSVSEAQSDVTHKPSDDLSCERTIFLHLNDTELELKVKSKQRSIEVCHMAGESQDLTGDTITQTLQNVRLVGDIEVDVESVKQAFVKDLDIPMDCFSSSPDSKPSPRSYSHHPPSCNKCGKRISSAAHWRCHLNKHARLDHLELTGQRDKRGRRLVRCPTCKTELKQGQEYENHIAQNHPELQRKRYKCPECDKLCISRIQLKNHLRIHHDNPMPCEDCGKIFSGRTQLTRHVRVMHKSTYSKQCKFCKKYFKTNVHLKTHIESVHLKKTQLCCPYPGCKTVCAQKKSLAQHLKIHNSVLELICLYCPSTFRSPTERDRHIKSDHPDQYQDFKAMNDENLNMGYRHQTQAEMEVIQREAAKKARDQASKNKKLLNKAPTGMLVQVCPDGSTRAVTSQEAEEVLKNPKSQAQYLYVQIAGTEATAAAAAKGGADDATAVELPPVMLDTLIQEEGATSSSVAEGRVVATFDNPEDMERFIRGLKDGEEWTDSGEAPSEYYVSVNDVAQ